MVQKLELFNSSYDYSIGINNNLKELFVRGDVDISGNILMTGNINCSEINSTSIRATTFYGDGSQLTGIIASGDSANLNDYSDASFGNVDVSGNININGKATITINDVNAQNITLLELKTNSNTPRIKHDFWQNSTGYGDYQIYPASASTTDFKIGGYSSSFQTIRLNALNGIEVYNNQSTNTYGNIKCDTLELINKIKGPSDLVIDPSPHDSSGGNVIIMGNLAIYGNISATTFYGDGSQLTGINEDQIVSLTGSGATTVSGTYPNFTISSTDTNTDTTYTAGTGLELSGTEFINTAPDQIVSLTGSGATTVSGTYPNFTISSTDTNTDTTYTAGTGVSIDSSNQISVGQEVSTTSNVQFNHITGSGLQVNGLSYISHPTAPTVGNPVTNFKIDGSYDGLGSSFQILMGRLVASGGYGAAHATLKMVGGGLRGMQIGEEDGANAYLDVKAGRSISYRTPNSASYMGHHFWGYVFNFNGSSVSSDDRLKWEEEDITNGLEVINKLKPQIYWKGQELDIEPSEEERTRESGYIAQQVKQIPELAHIVKQVYNKDNTPERYFLDYTQIHAYHTSAIQELHIIVENQQNTINILNEENTIIKNALNQLLNDAGKPNI